MFHEEADSNDRINQKQECRCKAVLSTTSPFGLSDLAASWRCERNLTETKKSSSHMGIVQYSSR